MPSMLIVDDELKDARVVWGDPLNEDYGWSVSYAGGYREAIEALSNASFDVVLLDRQMPHPRTGELDKEVGDELLEEIVARWPDVCPIMLTHNADVDSAKLDTSRGAYEYFDKRVTHAKLDAACKRGMRWIRMKSLREEFLGLQSVEEILAAALRKVELENDSYCLGYVEITSNGTFLLRHIGCESATTEPQQVRSRFFAEDDADREFLRGIAESKRFRFLKDERELSKNAALSSEPAVRIIVPVLSNHSGFHESDNDRDHDDDNEQSKKNSVIGFLWVESSDTNALNREDAEMMGILANYIAEALDRIRRNQKLRRETGKDARRWLLAAAAREISEPLQSAQTDLELLLHRITGIDAQLPARDLTPRLTQVTQYLENAVQAAVELRADSWEVELTHRPIDLVELVRDRCESFRSRALAAGCTLTPNIDPWPALSLKVNLDRAQMRYALDCLLENALEAIEEKRRHTKEPDLNGEIFVSIAVDAENQDVLLSIVDDGCGIKRDDLPKIFDRYFTTKESTLRDGNYSMGLSQVKRLVEACGGEIEACNAPKGGAEFTLLFPVVHSSE